MLALVANLNPLAAGADEVLQRSVQIQRIAHLVKVGHGDIGALAHGAPRAFTRFGGRRIGRRCIGLQLPQDELEQGCLAGTVGTQQTNLVTSQNGGTEIVHDHAVTKCLAHMGELRHQLAAFLAAAHIHLHTALGVATGSVFRAQLLQTHNAGCSPGAAGFYAFADPHLFLGQQLVCFGVDHCFLRQLLRLIGHIGAEVARVRHQATTVQLHDACRYVVQERAVVGNQYDGALELFEQTFQPFNRIQIQVVGWLVKEQYVRLHHQRLRQCHAFAHTAGQAADLRFRVQVQALQRLFYALLPVPGVLRLNA